METPDLSRQTNFIIVVQSPGDIFAIENSVEEAQAYLDKYTDRKAVVVSTRYINNNIRQIAYNQVQTFKKGEMRLVKENASDPETSKTVLDFTKNGLVILHDVPLYSETLQKYLDSENRGLDLILHQTSIDIPKVVLDYINAEVDNINKNYLENKPYKLRKNIFLRLHADEKFVFNKETLIAFMQKFGQETGYLLFLCQFILLRKKIEYRRAIENECAKEQEKFEDFIDPYYFKRDSSNFIYLNVFTKQIRGADQDFLIMCQEEIAKHLKEEQ